MKSIFSPVVLTTQQAEQLRAIVRHPQPTFPGDTISHHLADELCEYGLVKRDGDGNFVATEAGIQWIGPNRPQKEPEVVATEQVVKDDARSLDSHSREDMNEVMSRIKALRMELLCSLNSREYGDEVDGHVSLALDHLSQAQTHFRMAAVLSPASQVEVVKGK
jgi:hypothetical protein